MFIHHTVLFSHMRKFLAERRTQRSANVGGVVGFCLSIVLVYLLLLAPSQDIFSISALMGYAAHSADEWQALVVMIIPVYIAVVLFGGSALGWYLGRKLHQLLCLKS